MTHLDLFSGIGGFALASYWNGIKTIQFVEIEKYCQKVLTKNFPDVPIHDDIKTFRANGIVSPFLCTLGYPCQPFSQAGRKLGEKDPRHLWPEGFRIIQECRPTYILAENVANHVRMGLDTVLDDLESEGYTTQAFVIGAISKDAPHKRSRVFIVGYSNSDSDRTIRGEEREEDSVQEIGGEEGLSGVSGGTGSDSIPMAYSESVRHGGGISQERGAEQRIILKEERQGGEVGSEAERCSQLHGEAMAYPNVKGSQGGLSRGEDPERQAKLGHSGCSSPVYGQPPERWWADEPCIRRVGHGIPNRMDRIKGLGNSIVPAVAYEIIKAIKESSLRQGEEEV